MGIHSTSQKLQKLAQLARRTSMFDDPAEEINELSTVVKQDIQVRAVGMPHPGLLCCCTDGWLAAVACLLVSCPSLLMAWCGGLTAGCKLFQACLPTNHTHCPSPCRRRSTKQSRTCRRFQVAGPTSSQQTTRTRWWTTCAAGSKTRHKCAVVAYLWANRQIVARPSEAKCLHLLPVGQLLASRGVALPNRVPPTLSMCRCPPFPSTPHQEFKDVLTTRTDNLKAHQERKSMFSAAPEGGAARQPLFSQPGAPALVQRRRGATRPRRARSCACTALHVAGSTGADDGALMEPPLPALPPLLCMQAPASSHPTPATRWRRRCAAGCRAAAARSRRRC